MSHEIITSTFLNTLTHIHQNDSRIKFLDEHGPDFLYGRICHRRFPFATPEKEVWDGEEAIDQRYINNGKYDIEAQKSLKAQEVW